MSRHRCVKEGGWKEVQLTDCKSGRKVRGASEHLKSLWAPKPHLSFFFLFSDLSILVPLQCWKAISLTRTGKWDREWERVVVVANGRMQMSMVIFLGMCGSRWVVGMLDTLNGQELNWIKLTLAGPWRWSLHMQDLKCLSNRRKNGAKDISRKKRHRLAGKVRGRQEKPYRVLSCTV